MLRSLFALTIFALLAPSAQAGQPTRHCWRSGSSTAGPRRRPNGRWVALRAAGGWPRHVLARRTGDRRTIPNAFFQARLTIGNRRAGGADVRDPAGPGGPGVPSDKSHGWTAFIFRDAKTGAERRAEVAGHPCLAKGRVFSATAPVAGLKANQNSAARAALSPAMREVCNRLAGFHHASTESWSPEAVPALLPQR